MTGPVTVMTRPLVTARNLSFFSAAWDEDVPLLVVLVDVEEVVACDDDGPEAASPRWGRPRRRGRDSSVEGCCCRSLRGAGAVDGWDSGWVAGCESGGSSSVSSARTDGSEVKHSAAS